VAPHHTLYYIYTHITTAVEAPTETAGSYLFGVVTLVAQCEYLCLPEVLPHLIELSLKTDMEHEFFEFLCLSIGLQVSEEDCFGHFEDECLLLLVLLAEEQGQFHYIMSLILSSRISRSYYDTISPNSFLRGERYSSFRRMTSMFSICFDPYLHTSA
jgi:hypothetical protein